MKSDDSNSVQRLRLRPPAHDHRVAKNSQIAEYFGLSVKPEKVSCLILGALSVVDTNEDQIKKTLRRFNHSHIIFDKV